MLLTIGLIMIGWAIWLGKSSPVRYPKRKAKYNLGGIKATLKATPDKPCKDLTEWGKHIFNERNGKETF